MTAFKFYSKGLQGRIKCPSCKNAATPMPIVMLVVSFLLFIFSIFSYFLPIIGSIIGPLLMIGFILALLRAIFMFIKKDDQVMCLNCKYTYNYFIYENKTT